MTDIRIIKSQETLATLTEYNRLTQSEPKSRFLIGLNEKGKLVVEKLSTWDFFVSFFVTNKATKYRDSDYKNIVALQISSNLSRLDKASFGKETIKAAKSGLETLASHIRNNPQLEAAIGLLKAEPKSKVKPKSKIKPGTPDSKPAPSNSMKRQRQHTAPQVVALPKPTASDTEQVGTKKLSPTTQRAANLAGQQQRAFAEAMSRTTKGTVVEKKVDMKQLNDDIKKFLLRELKGPYYDIKNFEFNLIGISEDRMHLELTEVGKIDFSRGTPTYLINGDRLKRLKAMLTQRTGKDGEHFHLEVLKKALAARVK